jgi:hypothetical protein
MSVPLALQMALSRQVGVSAELRHSEAQLRAMSDTQQLRQPSWKVTNNSWRESRISPASDASLRPG